MLCRASLFLSVCLSTTVGFAHPSVQPTSTGTAVPEAATDGPSNPAVLTQAQLLERVNDLLNMFSGAPTADDWTKLGPQAVPVLGGIARDKTTLVTRRKKAIAGLSFFTGQDSRALLKTLVTSESESHRIRGQAALSYALVAGKDAVIDLVPLLSASKHRLREATIKAFAQINDNSVVAPLTARLSLEPKNYLKAEIQKVLDARKAAGLGTVRPEGAK
ncbi:MAG: HEAT repeat domain-containing protein [Myxococcota bacterium]|nr:HEAT repeat domain-containing protein [Myxococcota bacterium]